MSGNGRDEFTPIAEQIPFDKDNDPDCGFISEDVQAVIEELCHKVDTSASPGFTWGASGNIPSGTWLLNDTVPSNKSGRAIFLTSATLEQVFVRVENSTTVGIGVYEHDGVTFTLLTTVNLVATRAGDFPIASLALTSGKELAMKVESGSAKNPVVGCILKGSF